MEAAVVVARIFGLCYLMVGAGFLLNRGLFREVMEDFARGTAAVFYSGVLALVVGTLILSYHNLWAAHWSVIITVIGWGGVIKGIWLIVFPRSVPGFIRAYVRNETLLRIHSMFILVFGAVLTCFGYF
ncbi:MAG: hypothetical protein MJA29_14395 [Candidatus Omnitrophica bacterium]|nr:hypothetical protein [Candidatus Omnitrophota bacterium]